MMSREVDSTVIRQKWGEVMDSVAAGDEVTITRYHRQVAVIMRADKWAALQTEHAELLAELADITVVVHSLRVELTGGKT